MADKRVIRTGNFPICFADIEPYDKEVIKMRIDERNVMFSRMARKENTESYIDYYKNHPELKNIDDEIRSLPQLGSSGTATYDAVNSPMADAAFHFLSDIKHLVNGPVINNEKIAAEPEVLTKRIIGLAAYYGAVLRHVREKQFQKVNP
jgi:hypothetical protein